jgi:hypothetical protein
MTEQQTPVVTIKSAPKRQPKASAQRKPTARDKGVPEEYLAESGKFKVGHDAKYRSALIREALEFEEANKGRKGSPAHKQLTKMGWTAFLDKSRESRKAKTAKAPKVTAKEVPIVPSG